MSRSSSPFGPNGAGLSASNFSIGYKYFLRSKILICTGTIFVSASLISSLRSSLSSSLVLGFTSSSDMCNKCLGVLSTFLYSCRGTWRRIFSSCTSSSSLRTALYSCLFVYLYSSVCSFFAIKLNSFSVLINISLCLTYTSIFFLYCSSLLSPESFSSESSTSSRSAYSFISSSNFSS